MVVVVKKIKGLGNCFTVPVFNHSILARFFLLMLLLSVCTYPAVATDAPPEITDVPIEEIGGGGAPLEGGGGDDVVDQYNPVLHDALNPLQGSFHENSFYHTSLYSCSANYVYRIKVPPGTNGLAPELTIAYNSHGSGEKSGWLGSGWSMNSYYIQRHVNYTADEVGDDFFYLVFNGQKYDLIYVASEDRYHTKDESYLYIEKRSGSSQNEKGEYWTVKGKDGKEYRFGYNNNSETLSSVRDYVWRWNLDQINDTHGNHIYYGYAENPGSNDMGAVYLSNITYNNDRKRLINLTLETNPGPDSRTIYSQGSKIREAMRLQSISIYANKSLVRKYNFSYGMNDISTKSLITSIQEIGSTITDSLPSIDFSYQKKQIWWVENDTWKSKKIFIEDYDDIDEGTRLADVNGDGLVDILWAVGSIHTATLTSAQTWINNGSGWELNDTWASPAPFVNITRPPSGSDYSKDLGSRLVDVNGDGLVDILCLYSYGSVVYANHTWLNNGSGWTKNYSWYSPTILVGGNGTRFADVNGDGLVDILNAKGYDSLTSVDTWLNNGSGWESNDTWLSPEPFIHHTTAKDMGTRLIDVNGDGLVDVLRSHGGLINSTWLNNGSGWKRNDTWNAPVEFILSYENQDNGVRFGDVNGDGLTDILKSKGATGGFGNETWLNNGSGWTRNDSWASPAPFTNSYGEDRGTRLADINGDGLIDVLWAEESTSPGGPNSSVNRAWINKGQYPDLLEKVDNNHGGEIKIGYISSTNFDNTGDDNVPDLNSMMWCVDSMTYDNGLTWPHNISITYSYNYSNGSYDYNDKEFRGFGYIRVTDDYNTTIEHRFHQNDSLKGREYATIVKDDGGNFYSKTENNWSSTKSNGIYEVFLDQVDEYTYDGVSTNPNITRVQYDYDNYGNVNKTSYLGSLSVSGDERYLYNEYTYNTSLWVVNKVKHTYLHDSSDQTIIRGSWHYYDDNDDLDASPSQGDLTKEVLWLDTGGNATTTYGYDSYGNLVNTTDPNGNTERYTYNLTDDTFTFPEQITNAKGQTFNYSYNLSTGNLLSETDPNGFTITYEYDAFGRISKEIYPYDSSTYPTVSYTYYDHQYLNFNRPTGTKVSRRKVSGQSGTLGSYTFTDGFGRVLQTRIDAEDSSKQIVADTFYNKIGKVERTSVPYLATSFTNYTSPYLSAKNITFTYDVLGRTISVRNSDGTYKNTTYDHWKLNFTDENGNLIIHYLDAYGRITKVEEKNNGKTYTTNYSYNARDELRNITNNLGNIFKFESDSLGRKTKLIDPDMGTWEYGYDNISNLVNQTDARGNITYFTYDALNRITKKDYPTDTDVAYSYDLETIGTLSEVNDSSGTSTHYYYDNRLRTIKQEITADGQTWTTEFGYDAMDRLVNQTYPSGEVVTFTYNNQGELESIPSILNNLNYNAQGKITRKDYNNTLSTYLYYNPDHFRLERIYLLGKQDLNYTFDSVGNIIQIRDAIGAGETQTFTYDDLNRLLTASESGNAYGRTYSYNSIGNIIEVNDTISNFNYTYSYGFGSAGPHALTSYSDFITNSSNIISCTGTQPPSSGDWTILQDTTCQNSDFSLSENSSLNITNGTSLTFENSTFYLTGTIILDSILDLDGATQQTGSTVGFGESSSTSTEEVTYNLTYDANGNLIEGFGYYFNYNDANQLWRVRNSTSGTTIAKYYYDANGIRFKKNESGTVTYYVGTHFETKVYSNGTVENTSYYFANGERVAKKDNSEDKYYYHPDHLGSTNLITNESGDEVETTKYFPFGDIRSGGSSNKFYFTGKEEDAETGLYYYGARYYSPEVRRWVQADPQILDIYNPQNLNRYSYTLNNPLVYIDPTGEHPIFIGAGIAYLAGSAWGAGEYWLEHGGSLSDVLYSSGAQALSRQRAAEFTMGYAVGTAIATVGAPAAIVGMGSAMSMQVSENFMTGEEITKNVRQAGAYGFMLGFGFDVAGRAISKTGIFQKADALRTQYAGYQKQLDKPTLEAAKKELGGKVVKVKPSGTPYDHVTKVQQAQRGLGRYIQKLTNRLNYAKTPGWERVLIKSTLKKFTKLLEESKKYVPPPE